MTRDEARKIACDASIAWSNNLSEPRYEFEVIADAIYDAIQAELAGGKS